MVFADFSSRNPSSRTQLKDAELDAMIARARTLDDESERRAAYIEIQKYIARQVYALPIGGQYQFTMLQARVRNYQAGSQSGEGTDTYSKVWLKLG